MDELFIKAWGFVTANETPLLIIGTFSLAFFAFGTLVYTIWKDSQKPKLRMEFSLEPPHCHLTYWNTGSPVYYFRLRIYNIGKVTAEDVEVFGSSLKKHEESGEFEDVSSFLPMNFQWSHIHMFKYQGERFRMFYPQINPGGLTEAKHCDIFHINQPARKQIGLSDYGEIQRSETEFEKLLMQFDQVVKPNTGGFIQESGKYQLSISVSARNVKKPEIAVFEIDFSGEWFELESEMLDEGIKIRRIK